VTAKKKTGAWSVEARAKASATRAANRAAKVARFDNDAIGDRVRDALHSLHQCYAVFPKEKERDGMPGEAKMLLMLAIKRLQGRM
jgi:hypothetical protein